MRSKRHSTLVLVISVPIFLGLLQGCNSFLKSEGPKKTDSLEERKTWDTYLELAKLAPKELSYMSYIHIKDPDGKRLVWAMSQQGAEEMKPMLVAYPYETIDGITFYKVGSWKETSKLTTLAHKDRDRMIWNLFKEVSYLKSRVTKVEKKLSEFSKKSVEDNPESQ